MLGLSRPFNYRLRYRMTAPQPRKYMYLRFGLFRFRSPLLAESRLISSPRGTEMFHFPRFASHRYVFTVG